MSCHNYQLSIDNVKGHMTRTRLTRHIPEPSKTRTGEKRTWPAMADLKKHSKDADGSSSLMSSVLSHKDAISFGNCCIPDPWSWNSRSTASNWSIIFCNASAFSTASLSCEPLASLTASTAGMQAEICFWSCTNSPGVAFAAGSAAINSFNLSQSTVHSDLAFSSVKACLDTSIARVQRVLPGILAHWPSDQCFHSIISKNAAPYHLQHCMLVGYIILYNSTSHFKGTNLANSIKTNYFNCAVFSRALLRRSNVQRGDEELLFARTILISETCSADKLCTGATPGTIARQSIIITHTKNFCMSIKTLVQNPDAFSCWSAPSDSVSSSPKGVLYITPVCQTR